MADNAYSSRAHRALLRSRGITAVIAEPRDQQANRKRRGARGGRPPKDSWRTCPRRSPTTSLMRVAAYAGLRIGEVGALRIRDIDLRHGEIQVRLNRTETSKGLTDGTPKSKASVRDVPILDETLLRELATYLRQHPHRDNLEADLWPGK